MITIKQIFERLNNIFPTNYKSFDCEFRQHRGDPDIKVEWTLHVSEHGICQSFADLRQMDLYIQAIEENLMKKQYNPKVVQEAIEEAEKLIEEHSHA